MTFYLILETISRILPLSSTLNVVLRVWATLGSGWSGHRNGCFSRGPFAEAEGRVELRARQVDHWMPLSNIIRLHSIPSRKNAKNFAISCLVVFCKHANRFFVLFQIYGIIKQSPGILSFNFCHTNHNAGCTWPDFENKNILPFNQSLSQKLHWKYNSHWAVWALTQLLCALISYDIWWKGK